MFLLNIKWRQGRFFPCGIKNAQKQNRLITLLKLADLLVLISQIILMLTLERMCVSFGACM